MINIKSMLREAQAKFGSRNFVFTKKDGGFEPISYADFISKTNALADEMLSCGYADKNIIIIGKAHKYVFDIFSSHRFSHLREKLFIFERNEKTGLTVLVLPEYVIHLLRRVGRETHHFYSVYQTDTIGTVNDVLSYIKLSLVHVVPIPFSWLYYTTQN